jgi:hypothetical protein
VDAPTTVAEFERRRASSVEEQATLTEPDGLAAAGLAGAHSSRFAAPSDVQRDAAAIVEAALTEPQRAMLEFERQWWRQPGAKEQAIRDTFGVPPTRYYQNLNALLDLPAALSYDAALVHRLLRLRSSATRGRRVS